MSPPPSKKNAAALGINLDLFAPRPLPIPATPPAAASPAEALPVAVSPAEVPPAPVSPVEALPAAASPVEARPASRPLTEQAATPPIVEEIRAIPPAEPAPALPPAPPPAPKKRRKSLASADPLKVKALPPAPPPPSLLAAHSEELDVPPAFLDAPPPPGDEELFGVELIPSFEDLYGDGGLAAAAPSGHAAEEPAQRRTAAPPSPRIYQVAEIVRLAGRSIEARFPEVWVEGEISNLRTPGHVYFTLKDPEAQLQAIMFRGEVARLKFRLADGLKVRARGRLTIYEPQGKFQLSVDLLEPAGLGALQLAFEQLKRKLEAEGLFRRERKRPLPFLPRCIGLATSPTGAAVRDIIRVAQRRCPARILVAPCQVQGEAAPADIVRALRALERRPEVELIIVGRGGGSIEDLWAFNDESVARAIAACRVPVISAVGHEVDFTIADFVADVRAATPSQAAELALPMHAELAERLGDLERRLGRAGRRALETARQALDEEKERLEDALASRLGAERTRLRQLEQRLGAEHPRARLGRDRAALLQLAARLERPLGERLGVGRRELERLGGRAQAAMLEALGRRQRDFAAACATLDALSPLRVLERGYALVRRPAGELVTAARALAPGDPLTLQLADGIVDAEVRAVRAREPGEDEDGA